MGKVVCKIILILIISYFIAFWGKEELSKIIDGLAVQILAIIVGLVIGAVGVLISSIGNLFNLIIANDILKNTKNFNVWRDAIKKTMKEIKDDVFLLIAMLMICLIVAILRYTHIPVNPIKLYSEYLNKNLILNWISISSLGLSFIAINDVVKAMFIIHKHYEIMLEK